MTTPTGTISLSQVNTELGAASNAPISLNQSNVRTLAGVPSGPISMDNLRGKTNFTFTVSMSPTSQTLSGTTVNRSFAATTATASTGTPTSYTWSITNDLTGVYSIQSGQGTATAIARVLNAQGGGTQHSAILVCSVVVNGVTSTGSSNLQYTNNGQA
jgi:hypothetical protein